MFYGLYHGFITIVSPPNWGEFDFWMFTFSIRIESEEADPVVKNRHFSISGTHEDAVGRDEGETGKGQVEGGGAFGKKIYFWEGRCDGLEKVNSPFWVVELQRFLYFHPNPWERWSILTSIAYFFRWVV